MALRFYELLDQTESTVADMSGNKPSARIRIWRVLTSSPDAIPGDPQCPIPRVSSHPSDVGMICDKIDTHPDGSANTLLTAYYSRDQRYRTAVLRRVPIEPESWGWMARDVTVEYPINNQRAISFPIAPNAPPGSPATRIVSELVKGRVMETRMQRTIRVTFPLAQFAQLDYIASQNRAIHTIRGNRYQFLPDYNSVKRIDSETYEARYTWEFDQGTFVPAIPGPIGPSDPTITVDPRIVQPSQPPYILRAPYATLSVTPPDDPSAGFFITRNVYPYRDIPDGWRALPGVPNLG